MSTAVRRYLNIREAADLTGYSKSAWHRRCVAGELEHVKLGDRILIPVDALDAFLKAHTVPAKPRARRRA